MITVENWRDPAWREAQLVCEGHKASYEGGGMIDSYVCTCGWTSGPYFDGAEWAEESAQKHIAALKEELSHDRR